MVGVHNVLDFETVFRSKEALPACKGNFSFINEVDHDSKSPHVILNCLLQSLLVGVYWVEQIQMISILIDFVLLSIETEPNVAHLHDRVFCVCPQRATSIAFGELYQNCRGVDSEMAHLLLLQESHRLHNLIHNEIQIPWGQPRWLFVG